MAHRIICLIAAAEAASVDTKEEAERAATDLILRVWEHRAGARFYRQPLQTYDDLFETLMHLQRRPFNGRRRVADDDPVLSLAADIEDSSKDLVVAALAPAAREAAEIEHIWETTSDHLPEDEQRRAIGAIWSLIRDLRTRQTPDTPSDGDELKYPKAATEPLTPSREERTLLRTLSRIMLEQLETLENLLDTLDEPSAGTT